MPRTQRTRWSDLDRSDKRVLFGLLTVLALVMLAVYGAILHPNGVPSECRKAYDTQYVFKDQPGGLTYEQYADREC